MTTYNHTEIATGESNAPATINTRLSALDAAIGNPLLATTVTGTSAFGKIAALDTRVSTIIASSGTSSTEVVDIRSAGNVSAAATTASDRVEWLENNTFHAQAYAIPTDGSDATTAFNTLIAALPAGATVQLEPNKTYTLNTATGLTFTNRVRLRGAPGAVITLGANMFENDAIEIQGDYSVVEDITINGYDTGFDNLDTSYANACIKVTGGHCVISNVRINGGLTGIDGYQATGLVVENCTLENADINYTYSAGTANSSNYCTAIALRDCDYATITDCYIDGWGVQILSGQTSLAPRVIGNKLFNAGNAGIYLSSTDGAYVAGNIVRKVNGDAIKSRGANSVIVGNHVYGDASEYTSAGIVSSTVGGTAEQHDTIIANNTLYGPFGDYGIDIRVVDTAHMENPSIDNNQLYMTGSELAAIRIAVQGRGTRVTNNMARGHTVGLLVTPGVGLYQQEMYIAHNNFAEGTGHAINLDQVRHSTIRDNFCNDTGVSGYGINVTDSTYNRFINNICGNPRGVGSQSIGINEAGNNDHNTYIDNWCDTATTHPISNIDGVNSQVICSFAKTTQMAANGTFKVGEAGTFLLDPNGSSRNFNPTRDFTAGYKVTVANLADATYNINFDNSGINTQLAPGETGLFIVVGRRLTHGSVTGGPFVVGEVVTGGTSSATGVVKIVGGTYVIILYTAGTFTTEVITGGTSGATATISTVGASEWRRIYDG